MQRNDMMQITTGELEQINRVIVPLFGVRSKVISGSCCKLKRNKSQYNITVGDTNSYKSAAMLRRIGEKVKEIMEVDEVYSFGVKLA